ncbi:2-amino-4-hydroxy-6-hydroxymethyldihydropteridinediphosphokinase [Sphingobacterium psychroaquaticum]|uniref:2-amino-4-hydroxy-6-hydroxymethyldihydropteridine pyrophosphokinase n=2 Tax=Sphingobacterium psychroaquaticum TaxID=561061 RepID=A0A1X7HYM1_9SPHI|nr:2-amino-4-hydroxy-6-hydroxymethyldihydropteridinediphosphokinase [Sphingobacterium psychroaquaticum]
MNYTKFYQYALHFCFMNKVILLLGANLGEPLLQLSSACVEISRRVGVIANKSNIYESEAWGVTDQPRFLNQALCIETELTPLEVLNEIQAIEILLGRLRLTKWGARTIDIDILYFNDLVYEDQRLIIPHPLLQERRFVLVPLNEIASEYIHPVLKTSNHDLLLSCIDPLKVNIHLP